MLFLSLTVALAADRFVETTGSDVGNDCLVAATPCATIQTALTVAESGDTVQVGAGSFASTAVAYPLDIPPGVDLLGQGEGMTTLFAAAGPVLSVGGGEHSRISGVSISSDAGPAVLGVAPLHATIDHITMGPGTGSGVQYSTSAAQADLTLAVDDVTAIDLGGPVLDLFEGEGASNLHRDIRVDGLMVDALTESVVIDFQGYGVTDLLLDNVMITNGPTASVDTAVAVEVEYSMDLTVIMRNSSISGPAASGVAFIAGTSASLDVDLRDVLISDADTGALVQVTSDRSHLEFSQLDFAACGVEALRIDTGSFAPVEIDIDDVVVDASSGTGAGVYLDVSRRTTARVRGLSFQGNGVGSGVTWDHAALSSNSNTPTFEMRASELTNAGRAVELLLGDFPEQTVDIVGNRFVDNDVGVYVEAEGTLFDNRPRVLHNRFDSNLLALEMGFHDLTVDARQNWFGTTSTSAIDNMILEGGARGDVEYTALPDDPPTFQVAGHHTRRRSEMLVVADPGSTPLVHQLGASTMSAFVNGRQVRVQHVEDDGVHVRVERPRLTAGTHTLELVDPNGHSSTGTFTVLPAPDSIVMEHQDWLRATGNWVRISNAPPNALFRVYTSADILGPPACPALLRGPCLQITAPYVEHQGNTQRTNGQGVAWIRVEPPPPGSGHYQDEQLFRHTTANRLFTYIDLVDVGFSPAEIDSGAVRFRVGFLHTQQGFNGQPSTGVSGLDVVLYDDRGNTVSSGTSDDSVRVIWDSTGTVDVSLEFALPPDTRWIETQMLISPAVGIGTTFPIQERYREVYVPGGFTHPEYVSTQVVVKDPNVDRIYLSPPTTMHFQRTDEDTDGDGLSNFDEHRQNTRVYDEDSDDDGCLDPVDANPRVRSFDLDGSGHPDDCEP